MIPEPALIPLTFGDYWVKLTTPVMIDFMSGGIDGYRQVLTKNG